MLDRKTQTRSQVPRRQVPIALDPALRAKAERIAEQNGISLAEVFRRALLVYDDKAI